MSPVPKGRIKYIDMFRGAAIVWMLFMNFFDFLSLTDIHSESPLFSFSLQSPTFLSPMLLFSFVTGMAAYILVMKRKDIVPNKEIVLHALKRYGMYIVISLPLTIFLFGISRYYEWAEAIQGLGLGGATLCLFLIYSKPTWKKYLSFMVLITLLQSFLLFIASNTSIFNLFPFNLEGQATIGLTFFTGIVLNMLFRGTYSLVAFLPTMMAGMLFIKLLFDDKRRLSFVFSFSFLSIALLLHLIGKIFQDSSGVIASELLLSYYGRSFSFLFYTVGMAALICTIIYVVQKRSENLNWLSLFGLFSFWIYLGHFLFRRVLEWLNLADKLPIGISFILTFILILITYGIIYFVRRKNA
tara:strand:- start:1016 stop:2080 length:1065 start_codon:yes stop_codon:yes gene_type:complete